MSFTSDAIRGKQSEDNTKKVLGRLRYEGKIMSWRQTDALSPDDLAGIDFYFSISVRGKRIEIPLQVKSSKAGVIEHLKKGREIAVVHGQKPDLKKQIEKVIQEYQSALGAPEIVNKEEEKQMSNLTIVGAGQEPEGEKMKVVQVGLVPIYERENSDTAVDARELHEFLENKDKFAGWIQDRIGQCGLEENVDYAVIRNLPKNPVGGRPTIDYALTLDAAKHISMIERNEKGKQARQYFIDYEKKHRPKPLALSGDFGALLIQAGQQIQEQSLVITTLSKEKEELKVVANQLAIDNIAVSKLMNDKDLIGLREAAKIFKLFGDDTKAQTVIRAMTELGWIYKMGKDSPNLPKSTLEAKGYFKTVMPKCNGEEREQAKFTPKGMMWAYPKLCVHFGSPLDPLVQAYIQSLIDKHFDDTTPGAA